MSADSFTVEAKYDTSRMDMDKGDRLLGDAVGRISENSGTNMQSLMRDHEWKFESLVCARLAVKAIRESGVPGIKASLRET